MQGALITNEAKPGIKLGAVVTARGGFSGPAVLSCKRAGYQYVQVNLAAPPTQQNISEIFESCAQQGVECVAIGCFGNPLHELSRTSDGISAEDLVALIDYLPARASSLPPLPLVIWSGSMSGQMAIPHPGNRSPHAVDALAQWTRGILPLLQQKNARVAFKPAHAHVLSDPNLMDDFLEAQPAAAVGVVMDPCSFLAPRNFDKRELLIAQTAELFGPRTALVHLRDARIEKFALAMTGPGQGQLGFSGLLKIFARYCRNVPWMVDGVESELQLKRSREYVNLQAQLAGVEL